MSLHLADLILICLIGEDIQYPFSGSEVDLGVIYAQFIQSVPETKLPREVIVLDTWLDWLALCV